jgi:O-antigen/teichoic acid export membrane protein
MMEQPGHIFQDIFRNTIALAVSRLAISLSTVCLSFFVARQLGAPGLGIYSAAMVFFGLISLAAEMGSTNYLVREISKDRSRTNRYLVHLGVMAVAVSCVVMAVAWVVVPHLGYSANLSACVYVVIFATVPGTLRTIQEAVFVAHQRAEFITYSTMLAAVANVGVTLYLLREGYGIVSLVFAFAIVQYVVAFCYFVFLNRYILRLHWNFSFSFAFQLIKEIRAFAGISFLTALAGRPEILILSLFKNDAQIGFYSAALRITDLWALIPQTYMTNVFPVLSHSHHTADRRTTQLIVDKSIKYLLAISLPLMAGMAVAARPIVRLIYGPGFEPSVAPLRILAVCIPLVSLSAVLWRLLAARDQQRSVFQVQLVTTIARLAAGYAVIAWLAALGAAIMTSVMVLANNLLLEVYVRHDGTRLGVWRLTWRFSLAALGMGAVTALFVNRLPLWLVVPLAMMVYSVLVFLLKALSPEDLIFFRKIWRQRTYGASPRSLRTIKSNACLIVSPDASSTSQETPAGIRNH